MKLIFPPLAKKWAKEAGVRSNRFLIKTPALAEQVIHAIGEKELANKTVIELNPGGGVLTRALYNSDAAHIILSEETPALLNDGLKTLADVTNGRVILSGHSALDFVAGDLSGLNTLLETPLAAKSWEEEQSDILVTGVADSHRFAAIAKSCIMGIIQRSGIFKYGRVNMAFCARQLPVEKYLIKDVYKENGIQNTNNTILRMFADVGHAPLPKGFTSSGKGFLLKIKPKAGPRIPPAAAETFLYVTEVLFRRPSDRLDAAICRLDPGAAQLLDQLDIAPESRVDDLTFEQLKAITRAYHLWPYRVEKSKLLPSDF